MTKKDLMLKALNNEETERTPVGFWFHFLSEKDYAGGLDYPELENRNAAGHKKFIDSFHPDFIKVMSDGFFYYPLREPAKGPPELEAFEALEPSHRWIRHQVSLVKRVAALQAGTLSFYTVFSPASSLKERIGSERLIELLKSQPRETAGALLRIAEGLAALTKAVITEGGADGVYFSVQNPDISRISDAEYRRYITPSDKAVLDAANAAGDNNILHICGYGGVRNHLDAWTDYRARAYNWAAAAEGVGLGEGKKLFGGAAVIGGFDNSPGSLLETGTRAEIEAFTERLIRETGKRGLIIGADCTLPPGIPPDRLEWVRQKAAAL
jgi:uroporphyrinogen decarboxylase